MGALSRIFLTLLLSATAVWSTVSWGAEDPHLDIPRSTETESWDFNEWDPQGEPEAEIEEKIPVTGPIEVPFKEKKPTVPPVFGAATDTFKQWDKSTDLPGPVVSPAPQRTIASKPEKSQTEKMADAALAEEKQFQDQVMEASVIPGTYRKILTILSGGRIESRPIKDDR